MLDFKIKKNICKDIESLKKDDIIIIYKLIKDRHPNTVFTSTKTQLMVKLNSISDDTIILIKKIIDNSKKKEYEINKIETNRKLLEEKFKKSLGIIGNDIVENKINNIDEKEIKETEINNKELEKFKNNLETQIKDLEFKYQGLLRRQPLKYYFFILILVLE